MTINEPLSQLDYESIIVPFGEPIYSHGVKAIHEWPISATMNLRDILWPRMK